MYLFKKIQRWLRGLKPKPPLNDIAHSKVTQRDVGVNVIRIRLPSGHEVIIVEVLDED